MAWLQVRWCCVVDAVASRLGGLLNTLPEEARVSLWVFAALLPTSAHEDILHMLVASTRSAPAKLRAQLSVIVRRTALASPPLHL